MANCPDSTPGLLVLFRDELPAALREAARTAIALTPGVEVVHRVPGGLLDFSEALGAAKADALWRARLSALLGEPALREALESILAEGR